MTLQESLRGTKAPQTIVDSLALVDIAYIDFDGALQVGQLLVHKDLVHEVQEIFAALYAHKFPIQKMTPIVAYGWDDVASMRDNNCSAFNYRVIAGTDRLSNHATGHALDINPLQNPYFTAVGESSPPGLEYHPDARGTIIASDIVVSTFKKYGWEWGGDWDMIKDYQHFQKP